MAVQTKQKRMKPAKPATGMTPMTPMSPMSQPATKKKEARPKCPTGQMYDVNVKKCVKSKNHKVEK